MRRLLPFVLSSLVSGVIVFAVITLADRSERAQVRSEANSRAIVVAVGRACDLLNRKIADAQRPPGPDSSTALLLAEIARHMTPATRRELQRRMAAESRHPQLTTANCEFEARRAVADALAEL